MILPLVVTVALAGQTDAVDYLETYGAEYVAVVGAGALLAAGATNSLEPLPASIGPQISLTDPDMKLLLDPRLDGVIGKPILQEKVPVWALGAVIAGLTAADAGVDLAVRQDLHRTHAIVLGTAEAVVGAEVITEAMKLGFGRLRPDFRERFIRAACAGVIDKPSGLDCTAVKDDGFVVDRDQLLDGMKSFPSGHASAAFAAASFLALQVGAEHLWGRDAPEWARPVAGLAVGALVAGAAYVAATRVEDDRHHLEDIAVGAGIGTATGIAAYMIHFDLDDHARRRGVAVTPMPVAGGAGVGVTGAL